MPIKLGLEVDGGLEPGRVGIRFVEIEEARDQECVVLQECRTRGASVQIDAAQSAFVSQGVQDKSRRPASVLDIAGIIENESAAGQRPRS